MKVIKEKISLLEAKSLQSFLESHGISVVLSNEHGLDSLLGNTISVFVQDDDYNQTLRVLKSLEVDSSPEEEES